MADSPETRERFPHGVQLPTWTLLSAFRYALGRQSYIVGETIDLLREHRLALEERGWHETVAEEIIDASRVMPVPLREYWEGLAREFAPYFFEEADRAR